MLIVASSYVSEHLDDQAHMVTGLAEALDAHRVLGLPGEGACAEAGHYLDWSFYMQVTGARWIEVDTADDVLAVW